MPSRNQLANAIRVLSMDAVQKAHSGHPGMPMGMADIAEVLWNDFLQHNPGNPTWPNRDRFILSNGHGCMLQYALLYLTGYDLTIEDLKHFRQLHSKTPGHPEYGVTPGVETTTGPLGQGLGNAVGMALAEKLLAAEFNRESHNIIDHYTYCFVGDGCLMEGISHEVASLAGTLQLGKLIVFWDDNGISIDGLVSGWFREDTPKRFEAYGWQVLSHVDGHDPQAIKQAILKAQNNSEQPSLICCKTIIGFGAPNLAGTAKTHGSPLGEKEVEATRLKLDWKYPPFEIPTELLEAWNAKVKGKKREADWQARFEAYRQTYPNLARELERRLAQVLPEDFQEQMIQFILDTEQNAQDKATRQASQDTLTFLVKALPELFGGSADLSESNLTKTPNSIVITPENFHGNYIYYGVREFGMAAIMNGLALYKAFIPYGGTFLTFLDYARNAVRLSALMKKRIIYVFTHDSVGLGEDGPTHQPIEQLVTLRATPNLSLWRPCDATETAIAWQMAIEKMDGPTCLALTRQTVKHQPKNTEKIQLIYKGGYVLCDSQQPLDALIIATGSEVEIAMKAAKQLVTKGISIRVVSMPSVDVFSKQSLEYQESVLPSAVKNRVAVEAAASLDWYRWVGREGKVLGIDRFGESASGKTVLHYLGMTVEKIIEAVESLMKRRGKEYDS